ncbi:hypothetical protein [Runella sp.]|jgi:hypothetical protein|nr:hypothetical protein [Runella sp.]
MKKEKGPKDALGVSFNPFSCFLFLWLSDSKNGFRQILGIDV